MCADDALLDFPHQRPPAAKELRKSLVKKRLTQIDSVSRFVKKLLCKPLDSVL